MHRWVTVALQQKKIISGGPLLAKDMHVKVSYEQEQQSFIRIYVPHFSKSFNLPCPRPALVNLDVDILINFWHSQIGNNTNKYHIKRLCFVHTFCVIFTIKVTLFQHYYKIGNMKPYKTKYKKIKPYKV